MLIKLKDIVKITSGMFSKTHSGAEVFYLMARDYDENHCLKPAIEPRISYSDKTPKHLLKEGDILFAAKGQYFFAAVFTGEVAPAVASSVFLVLRLKRKVDPYYISWFLNHQETQKNIWKLATGSSIPSISKSALSEIEIPIPNNEVQQKILKFEELRLKEKLIIADLLKLREETINHQLINIIYQ